MRKLMTGLAFVVAPVVVAVVGVGTSFGFLAGETPDLVGGAALAVLMLGMVRAVAVWEGA